MVWKNEQVSEAETEEIMRLAEKALSVEGDYVELGCYKGDTALMLADLLWAYNRGEIGGKDVENSVDEDVEKSVDESVDNSVDKEVESLGKNSWVLNDDAGKKKLWIYDSFEGLPEKNEVDRSEVGADFRPGELKATRMEVKKRFLRAGLPLPEIKKGWFEDLMDEDLPIQIAFAFIDGDFYQSIKVSLSIVERRMMPGGIIVIHDYNNPALPGVAKAVDEWLVGKNLRTRQFASLMVIG